jgi:type III pantothenate kinase
LILLIDAGNSRIKSALWDGESLSNLAPMATLSADPPTDWQSLEAPSNVAISNVAGSDVRAKLTTWIAELWLLEPTFVSVQTPTAGVVTHYDDPSQLGVDRWLAAIGGYHMAGGAVAVVDAGTAITVDIVDDSGVHLGGTIGPGVSLMVESLTRNTARLRLDSIEHIDRVATNTATAISMGCIDALAGGVERMQRKIQELFGVDHQWIITGGEAPQVIGVCETEFMHIPDLVLRGLALAIEDAS